MFIDVVYKMCAGYRVIHWLTLASIFIVRIGGTTEDVVHPRTSDNVLEVQRNSRVVLPCHVNTSHFHDVTEFKWTKDGQVLPQRRLLILENGSLVIDKFRNNKKNKRRRHDSGFYECYVTTSNGRVFIATQLTVYIIRPSARIEPRDSDVIQGGVARLQCELTSQTKLAPLYAWLWPNGTSIPADQGKVSSTGVLQLRQVTGELSGTYTCQVYLLSPSQTLQTTAVLNVTPGSLPLIPRMLETPQHVTVEQGRHAMLECLVEGGTDVTITWLDLSGREIKERNKNARMQTLSSNLWFSHTLATDSGVYACVVSYGRGGQHEIRRQYTLDVLVSPVFTLTPVSVTTLVMRNTRLKCLAEGNPTPEILWYKDGYRLYPAPGKTLTDEVVIYGTSVEDSGYYQCIANNSVGNSIVTVSVVFKPSATTPDIVKNVSAYAVSATEIRATWSQPAAPRDFPITAYAIQYKQDLDVPCPGQCRVLTSYERAASIETNVLISDLEPYTSYSLAVAAFNFRGCDGLSKWVSVRTLEAAPTGYPNVQISHDSATSFRVKWSTLPESTRNGKITNYRLSYGTKRTMTVVLPLPHDNREYLVTGVEADTAYEVQVLGGNSQGYPTGDHHWLTYTTPKETQNETSNTLLTFMSVNETSVLLSWSVSSDSQLGSCRVMVQNFIHAGTVREFNTTKDQHELPITGLVHKEFYRFDFFVRNTDSDVIDHVTEVYQSLAPHEDKEPPPPVTLEPHPVLSDMITLSWEAPKTDLTITGYTVSFQRREVMWATGHNYTHQVTTNKTQITLYGLQAFTWYMITVCSHTQELTGPYGKTVIVQTQQGIPSAPENPVAEIVFPGAAVKLEWAPPRQENGVITYYIIYYNSDNTQPDQSWSSIQQNASTTSVVVDDLTSEIYYFKLRACTVAGKGDESHVIRIQRPVCDSCPQCKLSHCPLHVHESDTGSGGIVPKQLLGIVIGSAIGLLCIVISVTFVIYKKRQMRHIYGDRPSFLVHAAQPGRFLNERGAVRYGQDMTYSPMLARMIENRDFTHEPEANSALLAYSTTGSDNLTESSAMEISEGTPEPAGCSNHVNQSKQVHPRCHDNSNQDISRPVNQENKPPSDKETRHLDDNDKSRHGNHGTITRTDHKTAC